LIGQLLGAMQAMGQLLIGLQRSGKSIRRAKDGEASGNNKRQ